MEKVMIVVAGVVLIGVGYAATAAGRALLKSVGL
jgi:hypothetical protein